MSHQDGYQGVGKPVRVQISHSQHHQVKHQTQQHQPQNSVQPASNQQKFQQIKPTNHNHPQPVADQWTNETDEPDIEYGKDPKYGDPKYGDPKYWRSQYRGSKYRGKALVQFEF